MIDSVTWIHDKYETELYIFEIVSVTIFTIEYVLRIIAHKRNVIRYIFSFYALVDLIAILPFYIPFIIKIDLRFLRLLRLLRVFRVFKTAKYSNSFDLLGDVFNDKKKELGITIFIVLILMVVSAFLEYHFENPAQPEKFNNLFSSLWWATATLTTIGYGDIYPITTMGKIIGGFLSILGIGVVAMPTGILSAGLMQRIESRKKMKCPHCGKEIDRIL